jgi:hypothetical protein
VLTLSSHLVIQEFAEGVLQGFIDNIRGKQVTPFGAMHTTGKAEESLFYRITDNRLIIGSTWAYITVLEDGRKPGKFAPPEVIEQWIDDKPIISDLPKKSLAYLINKSLKENGSLIYQQGGKSGVLSDVLNEQYVHENLTKQLMNAVIDDVSKILFTPAA